MTPDRDGPRQRDAVLIAGTVGAGKTTTAELVGEGLRERGVSHAVIDLDWLSKAWPAPAGDPFRTAVQVRNLAAVVANFRADGAQRLVLAGVVETRDVRLQYERALGVPMTVCWLHVETDVLQARLLQRHPPGAERDWHLERSQHLTHFTDAMTAGDIGIRVRLEDAETIATRVLNALNRT